MKVSGSLLFSGQLKSPSSRDIAVIARHRKSKPYR
jgi:hypothetical protein